MQIEVDESKNFLLMVDNGDGTTTMRICVRNDEPSFDYTFVSEGALVDILTAAPITPEIQEEFDKRTVRIPDEMPEKEQ